MAKKDKNVNSEDSEVVIKAKKYYKIADIFGKAFLALGATTVLWFFSSIIGAAVTGEKYSRAVFSNPEYTEYAENESEKLHNSYVNEEISLDEYYELDKKLKNGNNYYLDKFVQEGASEETKKELEPLYKGKIIGSALFLASAPLAITDFILYLGTIASFAVSSKQKDKVLEEDERKKKLELMKLNDPDKDTIDLEVE